MRCGEASELMSLSLDEELPAAQMGALKEHLSVCLACQDEWIDLYRFSAWLSDVPLMSPSAGFTARVMSRLAQRQARPRVVGGAAFLLLGSALASVLATLLVLPLLIELWRTTNSPALFAGLQIVLLSALNVLQLVGQAVWVVMGALATTWSYPLFMSYLLLILLLTAVWVTLVKLQREKSPNLGSLGNR